jgi:phage terminase small subunit
MSAKISQFLSPKTPEKDRKKEKPVSIPRHLSAKARKFFRSVMTEFELEEHHLKLLTLACTAWDRAEAARLIVEKSGLTYNDRFGQPVSRPEIAIERDSRLAFARLLREIGLDASEPPDSRPPKLKY